MTFSVPDRHRRRAGRPRIVLALAAAAFAVTAASAARAQTDAEPAPSDPPDPTFLVTASAEHLWVVRSEANGEFTLLHRMADTPSEELYRGMTSTGRPTAAAARGHDLYLVYDDRSVQSIRYHPTEQPVPNPYETTQLPPLPREGRLLGFVAGQAGPVALIRAEPAAEEPGDGGNGPEDGEPAASQTAPPPPLQLLHLDRRRWEPIDLPEGVDPQRVRLLVMTDDSGRLALIGPTGQEEDESALAVDVFNGESWTRRTYSLDLMPEAQALGLRKNLFLVQRDAASPDHLAAHHLRGGEVHDAGSFGPIGEETNWWALAHDDHITLILMNLVDGEPQWSWSRGDTSPTADPPPFTALEVADPPAITPDPMTLIVIGAVVIGMMFLLTSARTDPRSNIPRLPGEVRPAGLPRMAAAAVDFTPSLVVAALFFGITDPTEIKWPSFTDEWTETIPVLVAIAIHAVHTTLTELFTGVTLGKALFGCRVTNLTGDPPGLWQVLIRGGFKVIELAAPLLLIMPFLSTHHQRLGDLVARTVVVTKAAPPPEEED